jgi:hypothetical protein
MNPIRSLRHNIPNNFETSIEGNQDVLRGYVEAGLMQSGILVDLEESVIKFPFADFNNRTINLHEPFLSYLWGISFSLIHWTDEYYQEIVNGNHDGRFRFNNQIRRISRDMFLWAVSLRNEYSNWPSQLPTPTINENADIHNRSLEANQYFLDALNFILYHELAHLVNNHENYFDVIQKNINDLTEVERALIIQLENEADAFSLQMMFNGLQNDNERKRVGLSVVLSGLSMLMAQRHPLGFIQSKHLDIDNRLMNMIQSIQFDDEGYRDYLYILATYGIQLFFYTFNFYREVERYETPRQMFHSYLDSFDDMRSFANQ